MPSLSDNFAVNIHRVFLLAIGAAVLAFSSAKAESNWLTDFHRAQEEAKAGHKLLLINFTGSDWCGWCKRLDAEVFSKQEFADYAKENLVLMTADFPRAKPLSSEVRQQNATLAQKFGIEGFPTIVLLNSEGKMVGALGYTPGGPTAFIGELKKVPKG